MMKAIICLFHVFIIRCYVTKRGRTWSFGLIWYQAAHKVRMSGSQISHELPEILLSEHLMELSNSFGPENVYFSFSEDKF